jgi:hypothetical protein
VFGPLKKALRGCQVDDVKAAVVQWFQQQPGEFFDWCVRVMLISPPMGIIFNGLYSFAQNNLRTGFV